LPTASPSVSNAHTQDASIQFYIVNSNNTRPVYSGQEQHLNGTGDPNDREAIWLQGYNTTTPLYKLITTLNKVRKQAITKAADYVTYKANIFYSDNNHIAIRKGDAGSQIVALYNNLGSTAAQYTISLNNTGYAPNTSIMEVICCTAVKTTQNGLLPATVMQGKPVVSATDPEKPPRVLLPCPSGTLTAISKNFRYTSRPLRSKAPVSASSEEDIRGEM